MKAVVFHGAGNKAWEDVPDPTLIDPTDAIVRVDAVTICGTDLHILKGDVPAVTDGRVLGHEAVGTVEQVGAAVTGVAAGDRVLVSCISSCGRCRFCRDGAYGQCLNGGGWILGHLIDGTQAENVRVPFADTSLYHLPDGVDTEAALMLADILPTGFEVGVLNGAVQPGDVVAVVGAGPIGLAAMLTAQFYSPAHIVAIDLADSRLEAAKQFGATVTITPSTQSRRCRRSPTAWAPMSPSRRSACPQPSSSAPGSSGRAVGSPTSGCTAHPPPSTSRTCGSATSRSPRDWSTPTPRRGC